MRRLLITAALLVALGTTAAMALAQGEPAVTEQVLGAASISHGYTIETRRPADVVVAKATVPPGASFGWHSHLASVVAVVKTGTLTLYDSADRRCRPRRYSAGQGFFEHRGHVHLARNEGSKPVVVLVTYLGLRHGVNPDVPAPSPGNCPF